MDDYYDLFDYEGSTWIDLKSCLENQPFETMEIFYDFINSNLPTFCEFRTVEELRSSISTEQLLVTFNYIREQALELFHQFPSGRMKRLNLNNQIIVFTRRQILTLLCHMFLCTLKRSEQNAYWVTFENWLTDGRGCAMAYLQCLIGYFDQARHAADYPEISGFWDEPITFQRVEVDVTSTLSKIESCRARILIPTVYAQGKIGDTSPVEVDFANKDIGFGTYGTQEEVIFGTSPELCITMLFCDTMLDNEAIVIQGARKVGVFEGYGSSLKFLRSLPIEDPVRNERFVVAMDATDYSEFPDPTQIQFEQRHLQRELCKLISGLSALPPHSVVDTGNWGCGAFCGNKYLKVLLQVLASTISGVNLSFYTFGDDKFSHELEQLCRLMTNHSILVHPLWQFLLNYKPTPDDEENLFFEIEKWVRSMDKDV